MNLNIFSWFRKEEKEVYPYSYISVDFSDIAKMKGIFDDFNLVIKIVKENQVIEEYPYTKELLESIKKVEELPVELKYLNFVEDEEDFEFYPFPDLDVIRYRK